MVIEIYIKYIGKVILDKIFICLKFGSKFFIDNEFYKIYCNLLYLGGIFL